MTAYEEKSAWEVDEGDTVVFSQFIGPHHEGMIRAIDMPPVMITVNGKVIKAEEREIDTGGGYNVRRFLTVEIYSDCLMHGQGMTEQYRFESHTGEGLPVFEFMFTADERVGVLEASDG